MSNVVECRLQGGRDETQTPEVSFNGQSRGEYLPRNVFAGHGPEAETSIRIAPANT